MAWDPTLKARPTVYKGIQMRSRLEAGYAAWLDQWGFTWEYEPCAFGDESGRQYLPDFRLDHVAVFGRTELVQVYVEVKPPYWFMAPQYQDQAEHPVWGLARLMALIYRSEPDAIPIIEIPRSEDSVRSRVLVADPQETPTKTLGRSLEWCRTSDGTLGLASPVGRAQCPWPKDWWKGSGQQESDN